MLGQQLGAHHGQCFYTLTFSNTVAQQRAPGVWADRIDAAKHLGLGALAEPSMRRWFTNSFLVKNGPEVAPMRALASSINTTIARRYV